MESKKSVPPRHHSAETKADITAQRNDIIDDQDMCVKAPEWAEHQRLWDDDVPCDDGRSGKLDQT